MFPGTAVRKKYISDLRYYLAVFLSVRRLVS